MSQTALPTLEDLRNAAHGAWLWDGTLGRIVWANSAGLNLFDCASLFDLIDRRFNPQESGIVAIADLTQSLGRGEFRDVDLDFPSLGLDGPLASRCNIHSLADGRAGLLVVELKPKILSSEATSVLAAFAHMPLAAAFVARDGSISGQNAAAKLLFAPQALSSLLGSDARSASILKRLENAGLVSTVEMIAGRVGLREVRMTLQKLSRDDAAYAFIMLEDVTERRNLERQLAGPVQTNSNDTAAFEELARSLKDTIQKDSDEKQALPQKALAKPEIEPAQPAIPAKPRTANVPAAIAKALQQSGAAIAIQKDGMPAFVSQSAVDLFGCSSEQKMLEDTMFWSSLAAVKTHQHEAKVSLSQSRDVSMNVKVSSIPWLSGPAVQYVFEPVKAEAVKPPEVAVPVVVAAPSQQAEPTVALESDLMQILDIASDGIVTLDREGKILSFSAGAEAIFGYRIAEVLEKPLVDFLTLQGRTLFKDYLEGLNGPGLGSVFNDGREMSAIVKQGGTVPIFFTLGRLQSSTSSASYAAVMRDITSWKRTEKELREAKETAEEASRQKSEFLARISHELRTPLNAIIGFSEVMQLEQFGELKNDKYRGYVNDIYSSGTYLLSLINDLLDLSKIEAGKMELNFTAVSVVDATEHAVKLLQETATRGRVVVRRSFAEKLPRVVADLRALRQVMLNVISNAIKFTDPGGQVIISSQVNAKGELCLSIKDTGIGMNAAQLREALEPFKRVETIGRETQGTGLGLSLTKALVEANRAKFEISSETGRGTLIEIVFPTTRVLAE